jgi:thiol-disulfide isomerase/thioredoxin
MYRASAAIAAVLLICVMAGRINSTAPSLADASQQLLPFDGGIGWINSAPLTPEQLRGKVVLVDFWEYTCVNCLRTVPYEKAWHQRYAKDGFVLLGVHTPEFQFSGEPVNVAAAVKRLGITWPVVLDSRRAIWDRYGNDVWPRELLFDQAGRLVADHAGEGDYPEMERHIQAALRATHRDERFPAVMGYLPQDSYAKPGAVCYPHTGEMYVGSFRDNSALANAQAGAAEGRTFAYVDLPPHRDGSAYLQGPWVASSEAMVSAGGGDQHIALHYHAIQVVAVLKPQTGAVPVEVLQDGAPLRKEDAGADVRYDTNGRAFLSVNVAREYDVVMNKHFGQHELELRPQRPGLAVYTFDFEACEVGADR